MRIFYDLCEFELANISYCFKIYSLLFKCYILFIFLILYQCRVSLDLQKINILKH